MRDYSIKHLAKWYISAIAHNDSGELVIIRNLKQVDAVLFDSPNL